MYVTLTQRELLSLFDAVLKTRNNEGTWTKLLKQVEPLLRNIACKYQNSSWGDFDELMQLAYIRLWEVSQYFNYSEEIEHVDNAKRFVSYLTKSIVNDYRTFYYKSLPIARHRLTEDPAVIVMFRDELQTIIKRLRKISRVVARIFVLTCKGYSQNEISKRLSTPTRSLPPVMVSHYVCRYIKPVVAEVCVW